MKGTIKTCALGDCVELIMGQAPPSNDTNSQGIGTPFVKVREFGQFRPAIREWTTNPLRMAQKTDVLLCVVGATCGKINLGEDCAIGRSVAAIRPQPSRLDQFYLYYFIMSLVEHLRSGSIGAAQTVISKNMVQEIKIPLPELAEQHRIVALLNEAFEALATAKANAEQNLQNARSLPESHLEALFTKKRQDWAVGRLGELCTIKTGRKDVNEGNPEGQYPFFTCATNHTYSDCYSFDTEALLIAGNGNVGQTSYYSGKFEAYQRTYVLFNFKNVSARYLLRVLDKRLSATVSKQKLGNTMPYIKIGMLSDFEVPIPPPNEQEWVTARLNDLAAEIKRLTSIYERKLTALEELKTSLLHQAFNGEL